MKVLNKYYNSVSGSNQVQNLNLHPPIGMDTLDENEVDIGEVQSVEMYNELFDIPEQRDAPTKDCKGKGKVDYRSSSRKLKTKGSGWQAKSWVVGELIKSKFKGPGRVYKPRDIIEDMRQDYDINMSYEKAWRARENVYEECEGLLKSHIIF
ncbi:MuDRA-like transposase [Cucumis melo var. makuwa]|uniref:MuDRA-like transposase n=1 Tax=Cucumis melo var. makuwa TaxID=1194695 RepID=A0A5A7TV70_CUCMM|nr:MuDRA-like transposase [Cucumis melo var. makuwa]